jgi:hypothetical protein
MTGGASVRRLVQPTLIATVVILVRTGSGPTHLGVGGAGL